MAKVPLSKDTPERAKAELKYLKKGGAPKSLIQHEEAEAKVLKHPKSHAEFEKLGK